nr:hypothetical protein [Mycolicibacterium agri]
MPTNSSMASGGHLRAVVLPDLLAEPGGRLPVGRLAQQGRHGRPDALRPCVFRQQDARACARQRRPDLFLVDHRVGRHDDLRHSERQRPHRRAVPAVAHHQRRGREHLVVVQPSV